MKFSEKYRKKKILGRGAQGEVWLIENRDTGAQAAMKLYSRRDAEAEREILVLKEMGGKGIPYLIDYVEADGKSGIVMEYVEGKSLRTLLQEQRVWTEEEAIDMAVKIAEGLSRFHRRTPAMIYADLKPENIMVTPEGDVCLIDFGAVICEGEREKSLFGTRDYLPPAGEEKITPYRDTYGLGAILYEMLTGYRIAEGIGNGKADISHLSVECRKIMQKAVRIRAQDGYANAGLLLEDLKECRNQCRAGKTGRREKKRMKKRKDRKANYFICDLKRVSLHGHGKISGALCACLLAAGILTAGILLPVSQTLAAESREEYTQETITADTSKAEAPRDEYGRKLVIRKK